MKMKQAAYVEPAYIRIGIVILALTTALVHLSLNFVMGQFDPVFTLNGLGYLALLAALFLDLPFARDNRRLVRFLMIGFAVITIISWIILGDKSWWVGWVTKAVEVLLIALLLMKRP
jgi:hypothetical protein